MTGLTLGKGEVLSSILSGSTSDTKSALARVPGQLSEGDALADELNPQQYTEQPDRRHG
jgi:hypothetical protein